MVVVAGADSMSGAWSWSRIGAAAEEDEDEEVGGGFLLLEEEEEGHGIIVSGRKREKEIGRMVWKKGEFL